MSWALLGEILAMSDLNGGHKSRASKLAYADYLRANQTLGEKMMARVLFHLGIQAEPQVLIRGWIVDFVDHENRVIFEVDGPIHDGQADHDAFRDSTLEESGYRVFRITNDGVRQLMADVASIREAA